MVANATKIYTKEGGTEQVVSSGGTLTVESGGALTCASGSTVAMTGSTFASPTITGTAVFTGATLTGNFASVTARSVWFNLDNGGGTTIDDVILNLPYAITITSAKIVYVDATTGTVAGGGVTLGTTLGGTEIAASTAYENTKAVGTTTSITIASGAVSANGSVFCRHTGVAATQAGQAYVEIVYKATN